MLISTSSWLSELPAEYWDAKLSSCAFRYGFVPAYTNRPPITRLARGSAPTFFSRPMIRF